MTTEHDPRTRTVLSWLRDDAHENAERVLLRALDEVDTTPQRRSWWPARRSTQMNSSARLAIAAAAVLVVAVVGYSLLPGTGWVGSQPTPVPTSSPDPTPITFAPLDLGTPVAGGRYAFEVGSLGNGRYFPVELTLPAGWIPQKLRGDDVDLVGPGADGLFLGFFVVGRVYRDPCHPELGYAGGYLGPSNTQDVVNELRALAGFDVGVSSTVPIGDLQATHFVISNTIDTETAGCTDGALLPLFYTMTADSAAELTARTDKSPATNGGTAQEVWIVDRGDLWPLLIVGETGRTIEAGRATLDAILASITISASGVEPSGSLP